MRTIPLCAAGILIALLFVPACATPKHRSLATLQTQLDNARIDALAVDAALRCPDEWMAAENMRLRGEQFLRNGQQDSAAAAFKFAIDLYENAATCAGQERRREQMPSPLPPL